MKAYKKKKKIKQSTNSNHPQSEIGEISMKQQPILFGYRLEQCVLLKRSNTQDEHLVVGIHLRTSASGQPFFVVWKAAARSKINLQLRRVTLGYKTQTVSYFNNIHRSAVIFKYSLNYQLCFSRVAFYTFAAHKTSGVLTAEATFTYTCV